MPDSSPLLLTSPLLAHVPHAFSTRVGGLSPPPFDSLNFGNPGDLPAHIARDPIDRIRLNFSIVMTHLGIPDRTLVQVHQVHGSVVATLRRDDRTRDAWPAPGHSDPKADAIVTDDPRLALAVRVADCCPILLACETGRVVGAVHAGWRGTVSGVLLAAVAAMQRLGAIRIRAAIGPCISTRRFEIGPEVAREFAAAFPAPSFLSPSPDPARAEQGKSHADIPAALRHQLRLAHIDRIENHDLCTFEHRDLFFSHRRDHGITGRMIGLISPVYH